MLTVRRSGANERARGKDNEVDLYLSSVTLQRVWLGLSQGQATENSYGFSLKMEAVCTFAMLVTCNTTRCHIPEGGISNTHHYEYRVWLSILRWKKRRYFTGNERSGSLTSTRNDQLHKG
jgi:hypothetical protein